MLNQMEKKRIFANNVLILLFLVLNIMLGIVLNSCASNSMQPIVIWTLLLFSALNGTYFIFWNKEILENRESETNIFLKLPSAIFVIGLVIEELLLIVSIN